MPSHTLQDFIKILMRDGAMNPPPHVTSLEAAVEHFEKKEGEIDEAAVAISPLCGERRVQMRKRVEGAIRTGRLSFTETWR